MCPTPATNSAAWPIPARASSPACSTEPGRPSTARSRRPTPPPTGARLCLVEAPGLGPAALERRDAAVARLAELIARELGAAGLAATPTATEMATGGIHEVLARRVAADDHDDPDTLASELTRLWLPVLTGGTASGR